MVINGLMKTTLLDYPGHVAATIFLGGCNFRCPYCHNKDMVVALQNTQQFPEDEILAFLKKRRGILTGVCITGGEPTLRPDLEEFIRRIKDLGYLVKLDSNGSNPGILRHLNEEGLLDYIAMDVKGCPSNYGPCIAVPDYDPAPILESIDYIRSSLPDYEFRTTVVKELHSDRDFEEIGPLLEGAKNYFLQYFSDSGNILCPGIYHHNTEEEMQHYLELVKPYIPNAAIRGEMPSD